VFEEIEKSKKYKTPMYELKSTQNRKINSLKKKPIGGL